MRRQIVNTLLNTIFFGLVCTTLCVGCNDNGNEDIIVTYPVDVDVSD